MIQKKYGAYPRFVQASAERHLIYNETLDYVQKQAQEKKAFVFRPSKNITISRLERSGAKLEKLYELGFQDALRQKDALDRFIEKSRI